MRIRRLLNRVTAPFQLLYWQMTLPEAEGAKLLIEHNGTFLMIREAVGSQHWTFPGGRLRVGETPEDTARRKAKEEVGIELGNVQYLGSYFHTRQYKRDAICVYYARTKTPSFKFNTSSIVEGKWFTLEEMETLTPRSESVEDAVELYRRHKHA